MSPETINAIKDLFTPVFEKIGQGSAYGWEILVKGQIAEGIADLTIAAIFILITVATLVISYKKREAIIDSTDGALFLVTGLIAFFSTTVGLISLYEGLLEVYAPEYSALKMLIEKTTTK